MSIKKMNPMKNYGCETIKVTKFLLFLLLTTIFLLPLINYAVADKKPSYVGIDVNDVFIYRVTIDEDPYEDFLEDAGYSEVEIDNITDIIFDDDWDEDVEGWKFVILDIKDEKEYDIEGDEYDGTPYLLNFYTTEDFAQQDWDEEETNERGGIMKYDADYYVYRTSYIMGLYYFIAANNINWDKVADEVDEELEDDWDGPDEEASAKVEKSLFFFMEKEVGISTSWNPDEDEFDDFEATSRYNDDGVCMFYEWKYDGDAIIKVELEGLFFYEYWWIILVIAIAGIAITITVVILVRRKRKVEKFAPPELAKKPEIPKPAIAKPPIVAPPIVKFCPMCGKQVKAVDIFCTSCGASLKE